MRKTRRDFVKEVAIGTAGLSMAGALDLRAAAAPSKFGHYHHKFVHCCPNVTKITSTGYGFEVFRNRNSMTGMPVK